MLVLLLMFVGLPHLMPPTGLPSISSTLISLTFGQSVTVPTLLGLSNIIIAYSIFNGSEPLTTTFYKDGSVIMSSTITDPTDDDYGTYAVVVSNEECGAAYAASRIVQEGEVFM